MSLDYVFSEILRQTVQKKMWPTLTWEIKQLCLAVFWCRLCTKLLCSLSGLLSWGAKNRLLFLWVQVMAWYHGTILLSQERNNVWCCCWLLLGRGCTSNNALISSGKETRDKSLLPRRKYWKGHIFIANWRANISIEAILCQILFWELLFCFSEAKISSELIFSFLCSVCSLPPFMMNKVKCGYFSLKNCLLYVKENVLVIFCILLSPEKSYLASFKGCMYIVKGEDFILDWVWK